MLGEIKIIWNRVFFTVGCLFFAVWFFAGFFITEELELFFYLFGIGLMILGIGVEIFQKLEKINDKLEKIGKGK